MVFDTETQNPRADMSDLPSRANPSIACKSWLSSSDDQAPFEHAQHRMMHKEKVSDAVLETHLSV
jgi:hypothetical protein